MVAQQHNFLHYSVDDGLPSSNVYKTVQDSKGYIWFGTDMGLCKFDGYNYTTYTTADGLPFNDIWGVTEDHQGRLWLATFGPDFYYLENDSIHKITNPHPSPKGVLNYKFHVDSSDNVWIQTSFTTNLLYRYDGNALFQYTLSPSTPFVPKPVSPNMPFFHCPSGIYVLQDSSLFKYRDIPYYEILKKEQGLYWGEFKDRFHTLDTSRYFYRDTLYTATKDTLLKKILPINNCQTPPLSIKGTDAYLFQCDTLTFSLNKQLERSNQYDFLNQLNYQSLGTDKQNNLWISTKNDGVYMLPYDGQNTQTYTHDSKGNKLNINAIVQTQDGKIWLGNDDGQLYFLNESKQLTSIYHAFDLGTPIQKSILALHTSATENIFNIVYQCDQLQSFEVEENGNIKAIELDQYTVEYINGRLYYVSVKDNKIRHRFCIKSVSQQQSDTLWFVCSGGLGSWVHQAKHFEVHTTARAYALAKNNQQIWLGQPDGLFLYNTKTKKTDQLEQLKKQYPILQKDIRALALDQNKHLWIGTNGFGNYQLKNDTLIKIEAANNTIVKKILLDSDNTVCLASNKGLYAIDQNLESKLYTTAQGLASNEVNSVFVAKDAIYIGTNKGLTILEKKTSPQADNYLPFYIEKVWIQGEQQTLNLKDVQQFFNLNHRQNSLKIEYVCLSYESNKDISYEYKMSGIDQDWKSTKQLSIEYPILPYGQSYTFDIRAKDLNNRYSPQQYQLTFSIRSPWWETWWFRLSLLGLFLLFVYYQFRRFQEKERQQTAINKKFAELELQALQAQMNPHFIFNSLQAIQDFVAEKDERASNKYMTNFSRLMRLFLESSKEKYIPLDDELELLQLYIELEQLRFEPQFEYLLDYPEDLDICNIQIPSLLLQPFVENAINHGLKYKKEAGLLEIKIEEQGPLIEIQINDNGVGRKRAKEIMGKAKKAYKSRGMQIIQERLKTIELTDNIDIQIAIKDKINDKIDGTSVLITIPLTDYIEKN